MLKSDLSVTPKLALASARRLTPGRFFMACGIALILYVCRTAFAPLALALLFALLLSGPIERLHKYKIPRGLSASLILVLVLAALVGSVNLLWKPARQWYDSAPQTMKVIKLKVKPLALFIQHFEELRHSSDAMVLESPPAIPGSPTPMTTVLDGPGMFIQATRSFLVSSLACIVVTLFLLIGGPPMVARMTVALVDDLHAFHVMQIIDQVRASVGQFYLTTALLNFALGALTVAIMSLFGMPSPLLWGAIAAVLNFIPYIGSALVLAIVSVVALVTFDNSALIVGVVASYLALATIGGQVVQPLLVGRRLEINPLVVFLSLWFAGLFWGIIGVILAMPTLLTLKVVAQNSRGGKRLRALLGPNDNSGLARPLIKWIAAGGRQV